MLTELAAGIGLKYSLLNETDEETLRSGMNSVIQYIWDYYPWPRLIDCYEETLDADYTFELVDEREDIIRIVDEDPRISASPTQLGFTVFGDTVTVQTSDYTTVWVIYRKPCVQFIGSDYAAGTSYVAGDIVAYVDEYYRCILASIGNAPTNVTYWQQLQIPFDWQQVIVRYTNAKFLAVDGQYDKSSAEEAKAVSLLDQVLDKVACQQKQFTQPSIITYQSN
ncbi:MAG: hypothetical protein LLG40_06725 [Deltaproteobacteria bacterium]|nr:hypothetical protein [Deltaproteobacteria bacterium]